jgi:putative lipoprotein
MTEESKEQVAAEEAEVEVPSEQAAEEGAGQTEGEEQAAADELAAEETVEVKKQQWPLVVVAIIAALLLACSTVVCVIVAIAALTGGGENAAVTGAVTYRERIALPADAVLNVQLQDVSLADAPADVIGEEINRNPGQVPVSYAVVYDPKEIKENHTYSVRARIEDGSGKLLFTTTQHYGVITRGNPTEDVEIVVEMVGGAPPPAEPTPSAEAYLRFSEPVQGATVPVGEPFTVSGQGAALPEGNVVVQVLDRDGKVLAEEPTTLQGKEVGTGGEGTWSLQLRIETEPGAAGKIHAFSPSPKDGSIVASDQVDVSLGQTEAGPTYLEIEEPAEGATLDTSQPIPVNGIGAGLPEGNVVVQARDNAGQVLAQQPTVLQGKDVGTGGAGTWSVELIVGASAGTPGQIMAFSTSPKDGSLVASAVVHVTFGGGSTLEETFWVLSETLPDTEVTAWFENGQVNGSAGCNNYFGGYTTRGGDRIEISELGSTMMMCSEEIMEQEQAYLAALQSATSYRVEEGVLTLTYPGGALLFEDQGGLEPRG